MIVDPTLSSDGTRLPAAGDLALAGSLVVVALLSGIYVDSDRPDTIEPTAWWHWLLLCVPAGLVALRRWDPVVVTALATVAQAAVWVSNLPAVLLPVIVILYTAASEGGVRGRRVAIGSSVVLSGVTALGVAIAEDVTAYQLPLVALTCGIAIVLGVGAADRRAEASALAATITETELRAEHARRDAVAQERAHIGRELHDIIGHSLSVIAVRAEAADRVADRKPEAARHAMTDIAAAARSALSETRRILSGLQRSSAAALAPPPDLAAIDRLVGELAGSGVDVTIERIGCDQHPPAAVVAGGAYRIVQESLTNAVKHGGHEVRIEVSLRCSPDALQLRIENSISTTLSTAGSGGGTSSSEGSGLAGMAERARVLGGTFRSGPEPGGRFVVEASLPSNAGARTEDELETEIQAETGAGNRAEEDER